MAESSLVIVPPATSDCVYAKEGSASSQGSNTTFASAIGRSPSPTPLTPITSKLDSSRKIPCPRLEDVSQSLASQRQPDVDMATDPVEDRTILHVLCVSFHHRNGPQVEYVFPAFPPSNGSTKHNNPDEGLEVPDEWSFLPFLCLPDGAHATEEEFIYFHLPPVSQWKHYSTSTLFGLACYRQIPASELIFKTADVTRSTVQKAVVVLATQPILGSVRSKLGLVTQAFFQQRDFSKLEILETLFRSLNCSVSKYVPDPILYMGISLRDFVNKFKQKTLQLFKLLLLEKRILFFGQRVERLSAYQYGLVSLIPDLLRSLDSAGSPDLEHEQCNSAASGERCDRHQGRCQFGMPLSIFNKMAFFQPYIPLQQIDVLMSAQTTSFMVGTSNGIFCHHKGVAADVIVNVDTGNLEILNPALHGILALTAPDRKFIDDLTKIVTATWSPQDDMSMSEQLDFEGSDDDVRSRFEVYLFSMLASIRAQEAASASQDPLVRAKDYFADFNAFWIRAWQNTSNYEAWRNSTTGTELSSISPAHPCAGTSTLSAFQSAWAARLSDIGRSFSQQNINKAALTAETTLNKAVETVTDPAQQQKLQASASHILTNVSNWYSMKRKEWNTSPMTSDSLATPHTSVNGTVSSSRAPQLPQMDLGDEIKDQEWEDVTIGDEAGLSMDHSQSPQLSFRGFGDIGSNTAGTSLNCLSSTTSSPAHGIASKSPLVQSPSNT